MNDCVGRVKGYAEVSPRRAPALTRLGHARRKLRLVSPCPPALLTTVFRYVGSHMLQAAIERSLPNFHPLATEVRELASTNRTGGKIERKPYGDNRRC